MRSHARSVRLMSSGIVGLALVSCSSGSVADSLSTARTSVQTAIATTDRPIPSAMKPPKQSNENGRPDVTLDPCLDFNDGVITSAGLKPGSRQRSDIAAEHTFLGCVFLGMEYSAAVGVGNVTFEESIERYKNDSPERLTINGREALLVRSDVAASSCAIVLRMANGVMLISVSPFDEVVKTDKDGCDWAPDVARAFEPALPKDR